MPVLRRNTHSSLGVRLSLLVALCIAASTAAVEAKELPLHTLNLPPGFSISLYADDVPNARAMALSTSGVVFVGSRRAGRVYAVADRDGDHKAETVITIAHGLNLPTGVAFRDGSLYVAEVSRVLRYDDIEARLERPPRPSVVIDTLPNDRHHGWKFIAFGPDDMLYVPVGAPCNVCDRSDDPRYAAILRVRLDGTGLEPFAHGVRNSVGFDWHPETGELWFTDNGRDMLGDNLPADELNHAPRAGLHFGFPYCHEGEVPRPGIRQRAAVLGFRAAGRQARPARRRAGHAVLHRQHVPRVLPAPDLRGAARLLEPHHPDRLSRHAGEAGGQSG